MARTASKNDHPRNPLEFLGRGEAVPESFIKRRMEDAQRGLAKRYKEANAIRQEAAKYRRQLQGATAAGSKDASAVAGLLSTYNKVAQRKIKPPTVGTEVGGILGGRIVSTVALPFNYAYATPFQDTGNPTLAALADKSTGQMSCSATTDTEAPSSGSGYAEMGIYFHPMIGPGMLKVSATMSFCMQWATNSLSSLNPVRAFGQASVGIYGSTGLIGPTVGNIANFITWDEQDAGQLLFDFGCNHVPASTQVQVDPSYECALFVSITTHVEGTGWPGSIATSVMSGTVPSITFEFDWMPTLTEA